MTLPKPVSYYGKTNNLPEPLQLRAGPLSLLFEAGDLRYIRLGSYEIVRRLYVAVRDQNWGTVTPVLAKVQINSSADSFSLSYEVDNRQGPIDFFWRGLITGSSDGVISFTMEGETRSTFKRNRIGFCILHPMSCAGLPCQIEHVDSGVSESRFPQYIAPQQVVDQVIKPVAPFEEMQAMIYEVQPDLWAELRFEGDIFEMEDQRNWTDASYKTYCTPLRLPFPIELPAQTKIRQAITLRLRGTNPAGPVETVEPEVSLTVEAAPAAWLPRLGLEVAGHGQPLNPLETDRLKALNLAHLRVDLRLFEPDFAVRLRQATAEAKALGVLLEIALFLSDDAEAELTQLVDRLVDIQPPVWAWLIFHQAEKSTTEIWINLARTYLSNYNPAAKIGSGTNIFFTELNRGRPPVAALDLVCYSINPQVHAFDNLSLVETLAAQAATVESARQFCGGLPLALTPVTLKMRFNPNATGPEPPPAAGQLPSQVDERQMSLFGAGWTVGSLKYLAESGVYSATYYQTTGWLGVMETAAGSPLPEKFFSLPGAVFPLYHVLADVGEFSGGQIIPVLSSQPLLVDGLALQKNGQTRLLIANLSHRPQTVRLNNLAQPVRVRLMDETNVVAAMQSPEKFRRQPGQLYPIEAGGLTLTLPPYAVARIDSLEANK